MKAGVTIIFAAALAYFGAAKAINAQEASSSSGSVEKQDRIIITAVVNGRVRSAPNLQGAILKETALGTRFIAVAEKNGWDRVILEKNAESEIAETGWISKTITEEYDEVRPGVQFQKLAAGYLSRKEIGFETARQLYEVLPAAADAAKTFEVGGDLRLKSLQALALTLKAIPFGKDNIAPYKDFLEKHSVHVSYSEPAGEWYVRSDLFWKLHQRYKDHKIGELIAWRAAANPLPGECEGYINCYLYLLRQTEGEYLNFYPGGRFAKQSLLNINSLLKPIVADSEEKLSYYTTSDISDRADFNRMLSELRKIVTQTPFVEKQLVLVQINHIAEAYR